MTEPPVSTATITVRLIKSFEYRNIRTITLRDVDLSQSVRDLQSRIREHVGKSHDLAPPVRNHGYDTLKISHQAHGSKTSDTAIDTTNDDETLLRDVDRTLIKSGVKDQTEISFFKWTEYEAYKLNPTHKW